MIYILEAVGAEAVKIGYASSYSHVFQRRKALQIGSPLKLRIVRILDGEPADEQTLHEHFADLRCRGEWFKYTGALRDAIEATPIMGSDLASDLDTARQRYDLTGVLKNNRLTWVGVEYLAVLELTFLQEGYDSAFLAGGPRFSEMLESGYYPDAQ